MSIASIYGSGNVRRYHSNPRMSWLGQTNADHQGRCVQLLLMLHPAPSVELIAAVAFHDVGERWVGDLPRPFKLRSPEVAEAHAEIEAEFLQRELGWDAIGILEREDLAWLQLVDGVEAYAFKVTHARSEAGRDGWPEMRASLINRAWSLSDNGSVADRVTSFLNDLDGGRW